MADGFEVRISNVTDVEVMLSQGLRMRNDKYFPSLKLITGYFVTFSKIFSSH